MGSQHRSGPIFQGTIASAATQYIPLMVQNSLRQSVHIKWTDATSDAEITLEETNDETLDTYSAGSSGDWIERSDVAITGPSATAAGGEMIDYETTAKRARLVVVAAADTELIVRVHGKD